MQLILLNNQFKFTQMKSTFTTSKKTDLQAVILFACLIASFVAACYVAISNINVWNF